jgi:hypothetical protein
LQGTDDEKMVEVRKTRDTIRETIAAWAGEMIATHEMIGNSPA